MRKQKSIKVFFCFHGKYAVFLLLVIVDVFNIRKVFVIINSRIKKEKKE